MEERKEYCNSCGRKLRIQKGIPREEALIVEHSWGYFSAKAGERHAFRLCEACYDRLLRSFVIPAEITEEAFAWEG